MLFYGVVLGFFLGAIMTALVFEIGEDNDNNWRL